MTPPARFRTDRSTLLPVAVLAVCILPTAAVSWWAALLLVVPVLVGAWLLRRGVDVTEEGITARAALGSRTVGWPELAGIRVGEDGGLWLVATARTEVRLPVLRARDLPRLAAASGGRLDVPAPPVRRPA